MKTAQQYKEMTIREFTRASGRYETDKAGIYKICRKDYPFIYEQLKKEPFQDLLDCGCGTGAMISLLHEDDPDKNYTGIDITPKMIETAKEKKLENVSFLVGDCEDLPFADESFDAVICSNSFHHYPDPEKFFESVTRVLRPGGRLILQDYTAGKVMLWMINHLEMPFVNLIGHGDVGACSLQQIQQFCDSCSLKVEKLNRAKGFRMHLVARK